MPGPQMPLINGWGLNLNKDIPVPIVFNYQHATKMQIEVIYFATIELWNSRRMNIIVKATKFIQG